MKVLLSIKPEFVEKIISGEKKFEFRKSLPKREGITTIVVSKLKILCLMSRNRFGKKPRNIRASQRIFLMNIFRPKHWRTPLKLIPLPFMTSR